MLTLLHNLEVSLVLSFTAAAASSVFVLAELVAVKLQAFAQRLRISSYIVLETKTEVTQTKCQPTAEADFFFFFFSTALLGTPLIIFNINF